MSSDINRRTFGKQIVTAGIGLALARTAAPLRAAIGEASGSATATSSALSKVKISNLELSRLILGCNLITGSLHARELRYVTDLSAHYNTDEKVLETFAVAEAHGINTFMTHDRPRVIALLKKHRERGGKLQWLVSPASPLDDYAAYDEEVQRLVLDGVAGLYIFGGHADRAVKEGKIDLLRRALASFKAANVPAGIAAHALEVVATAEQHRLDADYYVKTLHHHRYPGAPRAGEATSDWSEKPPAYWCRNPEETVALMKGLQKPWIAYKVMAAGAIPPRDGFRYAFDAGAHCILAGMFDFQIAEDVRIANELLTARRTRST